MRSGLRLLVGLSPLAAIMIGWEILGDPDSAFFPPPSAWYKSLSNLGWIVLSNAIKDTLLRFAIGLVIGFLLGWVLGLMIGRISKLDAAVGPTLEFLRATPPPALIPLTILFVGANASTIVIAVSMAALWPIMLNTIQS